jgi:hypothetical protein
MGWHISWTKWTDSFCQRLDEPEFDGIYVMNSDGSGVTRLTDNSATDFSPNWGGNASPPGGGGSLTPPEQAINEAISTIQNLNSVPQSVKTSITALLRQALTA